MIVTSEKARSWRIFYCPVCGHVEWAAFGEDLPAHYRCPLCGAGRSVMMTIDDPRLARHQVEIRQIAPRVYQAQKRPLFHPEYNHYSYILAHPDGLILFDAPPLVTREAIEAIGALGKPRLLVVSHCDFVGFAGEWAEALGIPAWMGEDESPLPGNRFSPGERVATTRHLADDLEVIPVPGHSPGSLAVYWSGAPAGPVLCCGDALTVWEHRGGRTQLAFFQVPPVRAEVEALVSRPISLLASCGGTLENAGDTLKQLLRAPEPCARPYRGEQGGIWL